MESYSSNLLSSSNTPMYLSQDSQAEKPFKAQQPSYHASLRSIRKSQVKPWKKPIAPLPPIPPRVYTVDPVDFRDLVQKLTGATEPQPQQRLQSIAPPPLDLDGRAFFCRDAAAPFQLLPSPAKTLTPLSALCQELMAETVPVADAKAKQVSDGIIMGSSSLELNLSSPSSWCSFPLLSPGTVASLGQSTVL